MRTLLEQARESVRAGVESLQQLPSVDCHQVVERSTDGREVKIKADVFLQDAIRRRLAITGIEVLSEEDSPEAFRAKDVFWILDPLDGSFNFHRGCGPHAVSLALWLNGRPEFGVIHRIDEGSTYWGGHEMGAFMDESPLKVSSTSTALHSVLATGLPSRGASNRDQLRHLGDLAADFAKVRMIGSASSSLTLVAQGAIDAYAEEDIMLWDVAAGAAIVQGAGGRCEITVKEGWKTRTRATNGQSFLDEWLRS